MTPAISCPLWSSVYECQRVECAFTSPVKTECGTFGMYVCVSCFVVCGCDVSRRYINVCTCYMFSVINVYVDHLKFCVVCIDGRRCECNVVSNECNEPTSCLIQPIGTHGGEVIYFGGACFKGELGFLNCDDICMCVVNKQFGLLEFVFYSVYGIH